MIYLNLSLLFTWNHNAESWLGRVIPSEFSWSKPLFVQGVGAALERHDLGIAAQQIFQFGAPFGVAEKEVLLKNHNVLPAEKIGDTWIPMWKTVLGENHVGWWTKIHGFRWWNPSIMIARSLFIDWWNPFFLFDPHQLIINPHLWLAQSAFLDSYRKSPCFLLIHGRPRISWVANPHLSLVHCLIYDCQVPIFSLVTSSFTVGKSQYRWSKYQFYFLQSAFLDGCVIILYVLRKTSKSNFHGVIPLFPAVLMWSPYKPQVPVAFSGYAPLLDNH